MSEFSESYHLRGTSRVDASALLQRAGLAGFVFPALDGWVTFVAEGPSFRPNRDLLSANEGTLLHWVYGDDHRWGFSVFNRSKRVCEYSCSWENDQVLVKGSVTETELEQHFGIELPKLRGEHGVKVLRPSSIEDLIGAFPAYEFAEALGLTNYRWLSYRYLLRDSEGGHPLPPGVLRA